MNDKCPFCEQRLAPVHTEQNDMGTKVIFTCRNPECKDEEGNANTRMFFAYTDDIQY